MTGQERLAAARIESARHRAEQEERELHANHHCARELQGAILDLTKQQYWNVIAHLHAALGHAIQAFDSVLKRNQHLPDPEDRS